MANYQNNMRYGKMRNSYSQPWQNYNNNSMQTRESCNCASAGETQSFENRGEMRMQDECIRQETREITIRERFSDMPLAMAYVQWQEWCDIYEIDKGFHRGTIFAQLDKPFWGRGGCNR